MSCANNWPLVYCSLLNTTLRIAKKAETFGMITTCLCAIVYNYSVGVGIYIYIYGDLAKNVWRHCSLLPPCS